MNIEEIYMVCPLGFEVPGHVCKPLKSIYGLKQAARVWAERLKRYLPSESIYVDDILLATNDPRESSKLEGFYVANQTQRSTDKIRCLYDFRLFLSKGNLETCWWTFSWPWLKTIGYWIQNDWIRACKSVSRRWNHYVRSHSHMKAWFGLCFFIVKPICFKAPKSAQTSFTARYPPYSWWYQVWNFLLLHLTQPLRPYWFGSQWDNSKRRKEYPHYINESLNRDNIYCDLWQMQFSAGSVKDLLFLFPPSATENRDIQRTIQSIP